MGGKAWFVRLIIVFISLLFASWAQAEKRVALVVGNAGYQTAPALATPANDAEDMAKALKDIGFSVLLERNLSKRNMEIAIGRFARLAQDADVALFYYAGHGLQYRGVNYLAPIDSRLEDEFSLSFDLTRLDDVLYALDQARGVRILILDACRDNPLLDRLSRTAMNRSYAPTRGLARIEPTRGMLIAYSTQPNQVAIDGDGRNSPFASALIKELNEPGVEVGALFRRVAAEVHRQTEGRQLPELSLSLLGELYLNTQETDLQAWARLRSSENPADINAFIARYPTSVLVPDARQRLAGLDRERAQPAQNAVEPGPLAKGHAESTTERQKNDEKIPEPFAAEQLNNEEKNSEPIAGRSEQHVGSQPATALLAPGEGRPPVQPLPPSAGTLVSDIKKELKRIGCYSGAIDAPWTNKSTRSSIERFARLVGRSDAPREPSLELLIDLQGRPERFCPLECNVGEIEKNGQCVDKVCKYGYRLTEDGRCERHRDQAKKLHPEKKTPTPTGTSGGKREPVRAASRPTVPTRKAQKPQSSTAKPPARNSYEAMWMQCRRTVKGKANRFVRIDACVRSGGQM